MDLAGASVIVVGATGGLGSAIARRLSARGAVLTLTARDAGRLAGLELPGAVVAADLADAEAPDRIVSAALAHHGRIDGLVNAAGAVAFGPLADVSDRVLHELFTVNVLGPLRMIRAALPHLEGGFIANLSAVVAEQPVAGMVAYSASKGALTAADRALARELRRARITVIDARPPHTETGLAGRALEGTAPALPPGLVPDRVAARIVEAIEAGERDLAAASFG